jgi:hypothetical protein
MPKYRPRSFQVANGIHVLEMCFTVYVGMNDYSHLFNDVSSGCTEGHWLRCHLQLCFYQSKMWCKNGVVLLSLTYGEANICIIVYEHPCTNLNLCYFCVKMISSICWVRCEQESVCGTAHLSCPDFLCMNKCSSPEAESLSAFTNLRGITNPVSLF